MIAARQIAFGRGGKRKPYDAEIEYLESTGTQWIDTGVKGSNDSRWEVVFESTRTSLDIEQAIFGATGRVAVAWSYDALYCSLPANDSRVRFKLNSTTSNLGLSFDALVAFSSGSDANQKHSYTIDVQKRTYSLDGIEYSGNFLGTQNFITNFNILLFARAQMSQSGSYRASGRMYSAKCHKDSQLILDLIPVRKGNIGYMYDRVSGQLFGNQGTGEFVLGPDIIDYTAKDYVQDGLVRHIDGIENVGLGLSHDATALGWTDLSTGEVYLFSRKGEVPNWQDGKCWRSVSDVDGKYFIASCPDLATTQGSTIEVVVKKTVTNRGIIIGNYRIDGGEYGCNLEYYVNHNFRAYFNINPDLKTPDNSFLLGETKYFATVRDRAIYSVRQGDGSILTTVENTERNWKAGTYNIGRDGRSNMCWGGDIYAIRIYNRALTAEEIAHNYEIDKARFGL